MTDRAGRRAAATACAIPFLAAAGLYAPPMVGWWIGSGDVGPGAPRIAFGALACLSLAVGGGMLLAGGGRAAGRVSLLGAAVLILLPACGEILLRAGILAGVKRLRNPHLYASGLDDADYWKLHWKWRRPEGRSGRGNTHPLFGWAPRVRPENPLGETARPAHVPDPRRSAVLCLGDSFMAGTTPMPLRIPQLLDRWIPDADVYNFAVGGYGIDQAYLRMQEMHRKFRSPRIVFGILLADLDRTVLPVRSGQKPYFECSGDRLVRKGVPVQADSAGWYRTHPPSIRSYLLAWVVQRLRILDAGGNPRELLYGRERKKRLGEKLVEAIVEEARRNGLPLLIVLFYSPEDLKKTSWREPFLRGVLARTGVPFLDAKRILGEAARLEGRGVLSYFGPDRHPNEDGNRVMARAVLEALGEPPPKTSEKEGF